MESKLTKRALSKVAVAAAAGLFLALTGASGANAALLFDNNNYSPSVFWSGTTTVGNAIPSAYNDKASSLQSSGAVRKYCENTNCSGRILTTANDYNSLGAINTGLGFGETWSDRISGVR